METIIQVKPGSLSTKCVSHVSLPYMIVDKENRRRALVNIATDMLVKQEKRN